MKDISRDHHGDGDHAGAGFTKSGTFFPKVYFRWSFKKAPFPQFLEKCNITSIWLAHKIIISFHALRAFIKLWIASYPHVRVRLYERVTVYEDELKTD